MTSDFEIVLENYHGTEPHVVIPDGVTKIDCAAFAHCKSLRTIKIPDSVTEIAGSAFYECSNLTSVSIPDGVTEIRPETLGLCNSLASVSLPESVTVIGQRAFFSCISLRSVTIPDGVREIGREAFGCCPITIICRENSYTHRYCVENHLTYIFDYQLEAFHGFLPQGYKKLASPFLADEEKPFIFISYSHKDRDTVLPILKPLYESGWKIWYDEGLTIGDRYDETLEEHVRNCSAFLLFVSENSVNSYYCLENEIPWANAYGKPIIRCNLGERLDFEIREGSVAAEVTPAEITAALETISGLTRGDRREAKGITVVVNPADRDGAAGDGFACCLYTGKNNVTAKAIMLEAKNSGCTLYDAVSEGTDEEKLQNSASLIVFLDRAFLADAKLTKILSDAYQAGRDIAVCQLENITNDDLPQELMGLHKMQWLHFVHGITADMNTKLVRHLQKRGCRNTAILPGFEYEKTDKGIIIKKYTGMDPNPRIESEYGGLPVTEISDEAFYNCTYLTAFEIPDSITKIGGRTFRNCGNLASITIPDSVTEIGAAAFGICQSLASITIPDSVKKIDRRAFAASGLKTVTLSAGITEIGEGLFFRCESLTTVTIPGTVSEIADKAFMNCISLTSITIPDSVTEIGKSAFDNCPNLTVICSPDSYARKYCEKEGIPFRSSNPGLFSRLFGKK